MKSPNTSSMMRRELQESKEWLNLATEIVAAHSESTDDQ